MDTLRDYVNWKLTHSDKTAKAEGYPLIMENCKANKRMTQLMIFGTGDGVGDLGADGKYKIPIVQRGINLFNSDLWLTYFDKSDDGVYHSNRNISTTLIVPFSLKAGTYRLSVELKCPVGSRYRPYMKAVDGSNVYTNYTSTGKGEWEKLSFSFTSSKDAVSMFWTYNTNTNDLSFRNFQIEKGNVATPYEPYVEPITTSLFLSRPLMNGGYINFKNKEAVYSDGIESVEYLDINLPILTAKTSIIEVDTSVKPKSIYGKYIKR